MVTRSIMTSCFYSMFINTGLMLMITNANFENTVLSFIPIRRDFNDFTPDWYRVIGASMQTTMLIAAFMPYFSFGIAFTLKRLTIIKDRGLFSKKLKTKMLTL